MMGCKNYFNQEELMEIMLRRITKIPNEEGAKQKKTHDYK